MQEGEGEHEEETYWQRMRETERRGLRKRTVRVKKTDRGKEEILNVHPSPGYGACELR